MSRQPRPGHYPAELRERAVRLVREGEAAYGSEWEAICAVAEMLGPTAETMRKWVRRAEVDAGERPGLKTEERERLKQLERENFELRRANEILRSASLSSRPSSTVAAGRDRLHRRSPGPLRGRADLYHAAVRPVDLLVREAPPGR